MPQIVAFAGPAGPFFLFLPFFFPPVLSPAWMGLVFSHPGSPLSRIRPQLPHTPPTGPVWGFGGVAPLPGLQNRTRVLTGPSLFFLPQNQLTPPPKGGGAGYHLLGFVGFALLVHNRLTLAQQGRSGALVVSFPYPVPKTAHRAAQGRVWFHRFFLARFGVGRVDKSRSSL